MAVIIIAINGIMKICRGACDMRNSLAYAHYLQSLFAADAGSSFKIPLQRAAGDIVFFGKGFYRRAEIIVTETMIENFANNVNRLQ